MNEIHLCVIILNREQWIIYVVFLALVAILFWNRFGNFWGGPNEELLREFFYLGQQVMRYHLKNFCFQLENKMSGLIWIQTV